MVLGGCKRDYVNILSDVVSACNEGRGVTHIMMASGLNYTQVRKYLSDAISRNFIKVVSVRDRNMYLATSKGLEFIRGMRELNNIIRGTFSICEDEDMSSASELAKSADVVIIDGGKDGRRGRLDLYACILLYALEPASLTVLCNKCFMNRASCVIIVKELIKIRLLEKFSALGDKRVKALYGTTEKGLCYLRNYIKISRLLKP